MNAVIRLLALLSVLLLSPWAAADALVRSQAMFADTIAEFFVTEDGIAVELEIGIKGASAFRNLLPDEIYTGLGYEPLPLQERLPQFFSRDMPLLGDGTLLSGQLLGMETRPRVLRDDITGEELPAKDDTQETVLVARLFYPYIDKPPQQITLPTPNRYGPANVGFVLYHNSVAVNDFRYLSPGLVVTLDWHDPFYSEFGTKSMRRSYSAPMSGFIYVEHFEVRKEIIVRPKDMQRHVDLGLADADVIRADQRGAVLERIAGYLLDKQPVTINGEPATPLLDRANFLNRTLTKSMVVEPGIDISIDSAVVGVIFVYPTAKLADNVTMLWDMFDERITRVPAASVDEAGPLPTYLEPDVPLLEWQNFLQSPSDPGLITLADPPAAMNLWLYRVRWWALAAAVLLVMLWGRARNSAVAALATTALGITAASFVLGRPLVTSGADSEQMVTDLLRNVYKAFDYREEGDIYDTLERSVSGDLLTQIYLETQRSLELSNQGGARAKVKSVEMQAVEISPSASAKGFEARATWNVIGSIGHWGHVHSRTNQYEAELQIEAVDDRWRLTGMTILQEQRL